MQRDHIEDVLEKGCIYPIKNEGRCSILKWSNSTTLDVYALRNEDRCSGLCVGEDVSNKREIVNIKNIGND